MSAMDFELINGNPSNWPTACQEILKDGYPQEAVQVNKKHFHLQPLILKSMSHSFVGTEHWRAVQSRGSPDVVVSRIPI